jgi:hypothetical protein
MQAIFEEFAQNGIVNREESSFFQFEKNSICGKCRTVGSS